MNTLQLAKLKQHLLRELGNVNEIGEGGIPFPFHLVHESPKVEKIKDQIANLDPKDEKDKLEIERLTKQLRVPYYKFKFKSQESYTVYLADFKIKVQGKPPQEERYVDISYEADGSYDETNMNESLRVMSTIVNITKVVLDKAASPEDPIHGIMYRPVRKETGRELPTKDPDKGQKNQSPHVDSPESIEPVSKRDMLYRAYIEKALKKEFPNTPVKFMAYAGKDVRVQFPKPYTGD